jgi:hypothetical protein
MINTSRQNFSIQGNMETAGIHYVGITTSFSLRFSRRGRTRSRFWSSAAKPASDSFPEKFGRQCWCSGPGIQAITPRAGFSLATSLKADTARLDDGQTHPENAVRQPKSGPDGKSFCLVLSKVLNFPGFSASYVPWCVKSQTPSHVTARLGLRRPAKFARFLCSRMICKS